MKEVNIIESVSRTEGNLRDFPPGSPNLIMPKLIQLNTHGFTGKTSGILVHCSSHGSSHIGGNPSPSTVFGRDG